MTSCEIVRNNKFAYRFVKNFLRTAGKYVEEIDMRDFNAFFFCL